MGMEIIPETLEKLHILTRLTTRENFVEFCRRESFKAYINTDYSQFGSVLSALSWTLVCWNKTSKFF